jgi:hypothetical protein
MSRMTSGFTTQATFQYSAIASTGGDTANMYVNNWIFAQG